MFRIALSFALAMCVASVAHAQSTPTVQLQPAPGYNINLPSPAGETQPGKDQQAQPAIGFYPSPATKAPQAAGPDHPLPAPGAQPAPPPSYYPPQPPQAPNPRQTTPALAQSSAQPPAQPWSSSSPMRDHENIWGLRVTPFLSGSYNLEEFQNDATDRQGSQNFKFSFGVGAFGDHRINRYLAVGGDFDFLVLNPKDDVSRHDIKMLTLGPALRLSIPENNFEIYLRLAVSFAVGLLPSDITNVTLYYSNGSTGSGHYGSFAPGYLFKFGPGVMYRTENMGFFVALAFEFSTVYAEMLLTNGTEFDLNISPQLFGIEFGATFMP